MHWITELLSRRRIGVVRPEVRIFRFVSVSAPVTFVFAGFGIIDDHAMVAIAIGDVHFVGLLVDERFRRPPEVFGVVTAFALAGLADLHQELSGLRELQNHGVVEVTLNAARLIFIQHLLAAWRTSCASSARRLASAVSADPDIAFVIDRDSVIGFGPIVAFSLSAPMSDQVSCLIELEDRRDRKSTRLNS